MAPGKKGALDDRQRLDITGETCPMTFVKTKLLLERVPSGTVVEIRLKGHEPVQNVPRAAEEEGHHVLSLLPEKEGSEIYILHLKRK